MAQKPAQALDDAPGALGLIAADVHRLQELLGVRIAGLKHAHAAMVVGRNRRQRLIEFVRDRGGELAERNQARRAVRRVAVLRE